MLDLLCVNPRSEAYGDLGAVVAKEPPLWCRIVAAYARDRGFKVAILDADALYLDAGQVLDHVRSTKPRLVAVVAFGHQPSASTDQMVGARKVLNTLAVDRVRTVLLGGHVSALPERTILEEDCTFACKGEGPETVVGLLRGQPEWLVPGLVWITGDMQVIVNKPAALLPMKDLHGGAWDLLPMGSYRAHNWQCMDGTPRHPYASVMTSLGCPYTCSFCCINAPFGANRYRTRDPEDVVDEIAFLRKAHGVRTFKIVDEMFVLNPRHYLAVADGIRRAGMGDDLNIWAYARVDTVKAGHLPLLRAAGFRWLALGIESGSAHVRDGAEKRLRQGDIVKVVRDVQQSDINVIGNYIFGLPDDDMESMKATLDLALECRTEFANFYSAMAYPGSKLHGTVPAFGRREDWRNYAQLGPHSRPMGNVRLTPQDILKFRDTAFLTYFTDAGYRRHVFNRFGPAGDAAVNRMLKADFRREAA